MNLEPVSLDGLIEVELTDIPELDVFNPQRTIVKFGRRAHAWVLCFTCRDKSNRHPKNWKVDPKSLSQPRIAQLKVLLSTLSVHVRLKGLRPRTATHQLEGIAMLLDWLDASHANGQFAEFHVDAQIARSMLLAFNAYSAAQVRNGVLSSNTAAARVCLIKNQLEMLHGKAIAVDLALLKIKRGNRVSQNVVPSESDVETTLETVTQVYDQLAQLLPVLIAGDDVEPKISINVKGQPTEFIIGSRNPMSLLQSIFTHCIACLALADSGVNIAQLMGLELDDELSEQLTRPEISTARQRAIKFRAGGRVVPVIYSISTVQRLRRYLPLRAMMLGSEACNSLFISRTEGGRFGPLAKDFLVRLEKALLEIAGIQLPHVTARQWRAHKQDWAVRNLPLPVAAGVMGHTIETAIANYTNGRKSERAKEIGSYLDSLEKKVSDSPRKTNETELPVGGCRSYGRPEKVIPGGPIEPDCKKQEGCLFCKSWLVHSDALDMRKLLSFRYVLRKLHPLVGSADEADRVYGAVFDVLNQTLAALSERAPELFSEVEATVDQNHALSAYWSARMQQLALLGLV